MLGFAMFVAWNENWPSYRTEKQKEMCKKRALLPKSADYCSQRNQAQ